MIKLIQLTQQILKPAIIGQAFAKSQIIYQNLMKNNSLISLPTFSFGANDGKRSKKQIPFKRWRIIRGDKVIVISGKDKGKQGTVIRVYRKRNKVLVTGINTKFKRFITDVEKEVKGGIKTIIHPVHVSNVALIDPEQGKPTKIRFGFLADGKKVRISKKSGSIIEKPFDPGYKRQVRNKNKIDGIKDTPPDKATLVTYKGEDFDKIKRDFELYIQEKERKEKLLVFPE